MDDARIKQLTEEVLQKLGTSPDPEVADLEGRVRELEAVVRRLHGGGAAASPADSTVTQPATTVVIAQVSAGHASLATFGPKPAADGDRCCLEPDKPCVGSGQCRAFGH